MPSNQDFEFSRVPVDVLAFYNLAPEKPSRTRFRFGAGLTRHINPIFSASGALYGKVNFDDATGFIAQIDAITGGRHTGFNYGIRFTAITYKSKVTSSIQGNGAGLFIGAVF